MNSAGSPLSGVAEAEARSQVAAARALLLSQAGVRRQARSDADAAVAEVVKALKSRAARELELERAVAKANAEQAVLAELLDEQAARGAAAMAREKDARAALERERESASKLSNSLKSLRNENGTLRRRESELTAEVNRRALQQRQLREIVQNLQRRSEADRSEASQALEFQAQLESARKETRELKIAKEEELLERAREVAEAKNGAARSMRALREAEARIRELENEVQEKLGRESKTRDRLHAQEIQQMQQAHQAQAQAKDQAREVEDVLQQKVEEQMLEIIRLQTEVTLRERSILEFKQKAAEEEAARALATPPSPTMQQQIARAMSVRSIGSTTSSATSKTGDENADENAHSLDGDGESESNEGHRSSKAKSQRTSSADANDNDDENENETTSAIEEAQAQTIMQQAERITALTDELHLARAEASKLRQDLANRGQLDLDSQKEIVSLNERLLRRERELQDAMREREDRDARELQMARYELNELQADMDTRILEIARLQTALTKAQSDEIQARNLAQESEDKYQALLARKGGVSSEELSRAMEQRQAAPATIDPGTMEEMRALAKRCQALSSEAADLREQYEQGTLALAEECRFLRDESLGQADEVKHLRELLETFKQLYEESERKNRTEEEEEEGEVKSSDQENPAVNASNNKSLSEVEAAALRDEALQIHSEVARVAGATQKVLKQTMELKRMYTEQQKQMQEQRQALQLQQKLALEKEAQRQFQPEEEAEYRRSAMRDTKPRRSIPKSYNARSYSYEEEDEDEMEEIDVHAATEADLRDDSPGIYTKEDAFEFVRGNHKSPYSGSRRDSAASRLSQIEAENAREAELPTTPGMIEEEDDDEDFAQEQRRKGGQDVEGAVSAVNGEGNEDEVEDNMPKARVILNGFLQKAPKNIANKPYWARWSRRWFVLTTTKLLYFRSSSSRAPRAVLDLRYIQVYAPQNDLDQRGCKFVLRTPDRIYQLCAESPQVMSTWIDCLEDAISEAPLMNKGQGRTASQLASGNMTLYRVLGVPKRAPLADITAAYEAKAAKFHPDVNPDPDMEAFNLLEKAYNVLATPSLRTDYNTSLDIRRLFEGGFVAMLHPEAVFYESGSFRSRKPMWRRFLSDQGFQNITWGSPTGNFNTDDSGCGAISLVDIDVVRLGEDAVEGTLLRMPHPRQTCCFTLVSSAQSLIVNIEVDSQVERDKIIRGLRILVQEARDVSVPPPSPRAP